MMAVLPTPNPIWDSIELKDIELTHRPYLGYSALGDPCVRKLWYSFHWAYSNTISPRIQRLFDRGNHEEDLIIRDLLNIGAQVYGAQEEIIGIGGHVLGHIDGKVKNLPSCQKTEHLFEAKTANDKRFKEYKKITLDTNGHANQRIKTWSPAYYSQINSYMGKMNLNRTLFVVVNKNTEERIYDRAHFDKAEFEIAEEKALTVLMSEFPLKKLGNSTWFECKFCPAKDVCHFGKIPEHNCRTCQHACIEDGGKWTCEYHNKILSVEEQREGCEVYQLADCLKSDFGKNASD